jgi:hypothetical protein
MAFVVVLLVLISAQVFACPVCYVDAESPTADGLTYAIGVLIGITGVVLSGIVAFFVYMHKRSKLTLNGSVDAPSLN